MHYSQSNSITRKVGKGFALAAIVSLGLLSIVATGGGGGGDPDPEPGVLQFSAATYSGNEDAGDIIVTVTRTGGSDGIATVDVSDASSGSATSGADYFAITTTTLNWADGDSGAKTFAVSAIADGTLEPDETVDLALGNATVASLGTTTATTVTILNDDAAGPGALQFNLPNYSAAEGDGTATITVTRTGGDTGLVGVSYATSDGTATAGNDYTTASSTLSWADGISTAQTFNVAIIDDTDVEVLENVNLTLSSPTGGATLGTPNTASLTITSEDRFGTLQFSTTSYNVDETDGTVTDVITLQRVNGSSGLVTVDVSDLGTGSATGSGTDYTLASPTTVTWGDGITADQFVTITLIDDGDSEGTETVNLSLGNSIGGASIGTPSTATINIADDEAPPDPGELQFDSSTYSVDENAGTATITVNRINGSLGVVGVSYATSNNTATAGSDYTTASGTLGWADGVGGAQTFTVDITNDSDVEGDETVTLDLSSATGGATLGTPNVATLTINDDDGTVVACTSTANDSVQIPPTGTPTGWTRIHSESFGIYGLKTLTRETLGTGPTITMDYMVHEPSGTPSALVVLIAGGQLNASIVGTIGSAPTNAGGNFLVRSAHLFADQGYRVLTIDRPSDFLDYTLGSGSGYAYDDYRTSMEHAVDLSELINIVNTTNLPVIIAGTSRGSISAVAQHELGTALAISAPLTSGSFGTPIGTGNVLPANVIDPVHISWHVLDECGSTTPANAESLIGDFPNATGVAISGGFAVSSSSTCGASHYHGFPGIESCAVEQETDWMAIELASLPATRPVASAQPDSTTLNTQKIIDLTGFATASAGGALTYSLPHTSTSLGGSISIAGTNVTYTPPSGVSSIVDTFVYVVSEAGGGTSHNVIAVTINP